MAHRTFFPFLAVSILASPSALSQENSEEPSSIIEDSQLHWCEPEVLEELVSNRFVTEETIMIAVQGNKQDDPVLVEETQRAVLEINDFLAENALAVPPLAYTEDFKQANIRVFDSTTYFSAIGADGFSRTEKFLIEELLPGLLAFAFYDDAAGRRCMDEGFRAVERSIIVLPNYRAEGLFQPGFARFPPEMMSYYFLGTPSGEIICQAVSEGTELPPAMVDVPRCSEEQHHLAYQRILMHELLHALGLQDVAHDPCWQMVDGERYSGGSYFSSGCIALDLPHGRFSANYFILGFSERTRNLLRELYGEW